MGDPLEPSDFLSAALRESRGAVADDGFSLRVARRALAERRRRRLARTLPAVMALLGLALAFTFTNFTVISAGNPLPSISRALAETTGAIAPFLAPLAGYGLPPWMILTALGAILYALLTGERDSGAAFRL